MKDLSEDSGEVPLGSMKEDSKKSWVKCSNVCKTKRKISRGVKDLGMVNLALLDIWS